MNTLAYADIANIDSSMASTIASSFQQMSMSFGLAFGSFVAAYYLGNASQFNHLVVTHALHYSFFTLGGLTVLSSFSFWRLSATDGESISHSKLSNFE